jgi:hypothetical protein
MRRLVVAWLLALASGGCGLISADVTETPFDLPPRSYSFDSATFNVPAGFSQPIPCGAGQIITDCCMPPLGPAPDCNANMIACEQNENGMDVCTVTVLVSQSQMMNLGQEVSSLNSFTGYVNVKIKRISYRVDVNTLNLNVPDVTLYLAPAGVTDTMDNTMAMRFGTLPAIAAGTTPTGDVVLDSNAATVLKKYTSNIQNPFNFIAETKVKVSQSPTGKIDLTISGQLAASL